MELTIFAFSNIDALSFRSLRNLKPYTTPVHFVLLYLRKMGMLECLRLAGGTIVGGVAGPRAGGFNVGCTGLGSPAGRAI